MKVLYVYAGERRNKFKGQIGVDFSDTQFYGLNHLGKYGIEAEYKEWVDFKLGRIFGKLFGFNLKHALLFFATRGHDIVFGSSVLNMMIFKKIFRSKAKYVLLNISLKRLWQSNEGKPIKRFLINWLLKDLDAVVCLSTEQVEFCKNNFPYLTDKIYFVPLGVDTYYNKFEREGREDYILSAGRDNARDYKTVIGVASTMPQQLFEIVASPRNLSGIDLIPPNMKVSYDISPKELAVKYARAKALLVLTHDDSYKEGADGSGQTVILEAMASGLPVITSRRGSILDYVKDIETGLLVDFYDINKAKSRVVMMGDSALREILARSARKAVVENFSTEIMAKKLSEVFKAINS